MVLVGARAAIKETNAAAVSMLGLERGASSLAPLGGRLLDPAQSVAIADTNLPWQRALRGESIHNLDLLLTLPDPAQRRLLTITAVPFEDPGACAPSALVMVVDRVQMLLRAPLPTPRRRRRAPLTG